MHDFCVEISDAPDPSDGYETRRNSFVKHHGGPNCEKIRWKKEEELWKDHCPRIKVSPK